MKKKDYLLLSAILLVHLLLLIFLKFTAWPEMSLWPYLMTKGWLPYKDIAIAHTPLMLVDLSIFFKIFGAGIIQLKVFTWILILLLDGLVFYVSRKLWNTKTAIMALMVNGLWLMFYDGNGLWFDLYMGLMAFTSFYFAKKKNWLWTGIFWALAFISKQTAVWFLIPIGLEMVNGKWLMVKKNIRSFIPGTLAIIVPFIVILAAFGILSDFWNWAVKFGVFTLPGAAGQIQLPNLRNLTVAAFPFLIFLPLLLNHKQSLTKLEFGKSSTINLLLWAIAGSLGAYPRFEFFHFQPAVPFLAIASAGFFTNKIWKNLPIKIFTTLYIVGCLGLFGGFFIRNVGEGTRFYETDVKEVALYIKYNVDPGERIFVMNWWDNLYALTDTIPSTDPWVPQLSWYMEAPGIQEEMIDGLRQNPPKLIIFNPYTDFGLSAYKPEKVYEFVTENYKLSGKVDGVEILIRKQYVSR